VKRLIVGLGNPGKTYERTRHNIGFVAVDRLAAKYRLEFHNKLKMKGSLAEGTILETPVEILKPLTFMNLSGEAVALAMRYGNFELSSVLIVVDDIDIPLGQLRMRIDSGPGTHNGLKSVEEHLQSNRYARLRIGVGDRAQGEDLADYVIARFSGEEEKLLPEILDRAVQSMEIWLDKGITRAMDFANRRSPSNPSNGE
jgi:PTH1 family peptidyl-tRNA hydrolase